MAPVTKPRPRPKTSKAPAKAAAVKAAPKKRPVAKAPAKSPVATKPRPQRTAGKVAPSKAAGKKAGAKSAPRKKAPVAPVRELNELGFVEGTDSAIIAATLIEGGSDKKDVNARCTANIEAANGLVNRNGEPKYIPSIVSGILNRMLASGKYEIAATWKLVPAPAPAKKPVAKRKPRK